MSNRESSKRFGDKPKARVRALVTDLVEELGDLPGPQAKELLIEFKGRASDPSIKSWRRPIYRAFVTMLKSL